MSHYTGRHRDDTRVGLAMCHWRDDLAAQASVDPDPGRHTEEWAEIAATWDERAALMASMARHPAGKGRG